MRPKFRHLALFFFLAIGSAFAQDMRDRTRPTWTHETAVGESQAADLTLTLSDASIRPVQTWVRTVGSIDKTRRTLIATINGPQAELIRVGQRVRAFPPEARSSMYQAKITRVTRQGTSAVVEATLPGTGRENSANYVMEIVADQGEFLTVPNEAIIEEGDKHVVYVQMHPGHYVPHEIQTGLQGELYTQILSGISAGDQVVTIGSFFIDSEYKLKSSGNVMGNDQHHH